MPYLDNRMRARILCRLKHLLEKETGYKYKLYYPEYQGSINLVWDIEEKDVPLIFKPDELGADDIYHWLLKKPWKEAFWIRQWTDPHPSIVFDIALFSESARIYVGKTIPLFFMVNKYYDAYVINGDSLWKRTDRMKAALIIPAVIKDLMVFDNALNKTLSKYGVSRSEIMASLCDMRFFLFLELRFNEETEIEEDELVEKLFIRAKAMGEWWNYCKAWLPSLDRREFYESTKVKTPCKGGRGFIEICKWPCEEPHSEICETEIRRKLVNNPHLPIYNFDRCRVKLVDNKIVIDPTEQLESFPLEKIEFLREDFPELFKGS